MQSLKLSTSPRLTTQELYSFAKKTLATKRKILLINDIDATLTEPTDDPTKTRIVAQSGMALATLQQQGHSIGALTNRAGKDAASMLQAAGITTAYVVGTYGYEQFHFESALPSLGTSHIADRYAFYNEQITSILHLIRKTLCENVQVEHHIGDAIHQEIDTKHGVIIIERKGVCAEFPEGLAAVYNLNLLSPDKQNEVSKQLEDLFANEQKKLYSESYQLALALFHVWGKHSLPQTTQYPTHLSVGFEPLIKEGKGYGVHQLIALMHETTGTTSLSDIGLIVMAGDSNADAEAMKAIEHIAEHTNHHHPDTPPLHAVGIWVKPAEAEPAIEAEANIIVDGPRGYAELLTELVNQVSPLA